MSQDDQEALAAQWAAQLEGEEDSPSGGDAGAPEAAAAVIRRAIFRELDLEECP